MASLRMSMPIIKRLLGHIKITSKNYQVYNIVNNFLKKLSDKDLLELEKSVKCQGKISTLCVVLSQSYDIQR